MTASDFLARVVDDNVVGVPRAQSLAFFSDGVLTGGFKSSFQNIRIVGRRQAGMSIMRLPPVSGAPCLLAALFPT